MTGFISRALRVVLAGWLFLLGTAAAAADPPPLEAYGRLPDIETVALSNSGERIAAAMTANGARYVMLLTRDMQVLRAVPVEDSKIRGMEWVGDDRLVVQMSRTEILGPDFVNSQIEFFHAFIVPADSSQEARMVFDKEPTILNAVFGSYGVRQVDGRWLAYYAGHERERGMRDFYIANGGSSLFAVDVETNRPRLVADQGSQGDSTTWLLGANGEVAATFEINYSSGDWRLKAPGGVVLANGNAPRADAGLVALGKDGRTAIYSQLDEAAGETIWYEVPLNGRGEPSKFATQGEINRLYTDRVTGKLLGLLRTGESATPEMFDPKHQAVVSQIYRTFAPLQVQIMDWTPDFSHVLVRTEGRGDSGTWMLVDMAQMAAKALGYERELIAPEHVGPTSTIRYKAADGLEIEAVLTLPPGREAKNLPIVVLPHGGPHAYDSEGFDWWSQAFASRGYAVLQPNFRGSTNAGESFMRAGFGEWGRKMQSDISDGLAELARLGTVDPKRACIMGASYGGYAALAGVTLQQCLYRCSVAVAPVSDLSQLFSDETPGGGVRLLRRSLSEELGPRSGFDAISPRQFADRADAPILLIHGRDDTVVPYSQSTRMAAALKDAGKPHELVELKSEDHWLSRSETRQQMLAAAMAFVIEHNPPD